VLCACCLAVGTVLGLCFCFAFAFGSGGGYCSGHLRVTSLATSQNVSLAAWKHGNMETWGLGHPGTPGAGAARRGLQFNGSEFKLS